MHRRKLARVTTVPISLWLLLRGQLRYMSRSGFEVVAISSGGGLLEKVGQREGVKTIEVPFVREISPARDIAALVKLTKLFREEQFDIVHSHTPKAGLLAMLAAHLAGVSCRIHTFAGTVNRVRSASDAAWIMADVATAQLATGYTAISDSLARVLARRGAWSSSKGKVIGCGSSNGLDTERFRRTEVVQRRAVKVREEARIPESAVVIVFVGRLVRDKGIVELVGAFEQLCLRFPDLYLVLAGPSEGERDSIGSRIEERISSNPRIRLLGYREDVPEVLASGDILCVPSHREGFGNVFIEAAAMGLPVVGTMIPGVSDAVRDGENGFLIEIGSVEGLVGRLASLVENAGLRHRLGENGRAFVESCFEQENYWLQLRDYYESL